MGYIGPLPRAIHQFFATRCQGPIWQVWIGTITCKQEHGRWLHSFTPILTFIFPKCCYGAHNTSESGNKIFL